MKAGYDFEGCPNSKEDGVCQRGSRASSRNWSGRNQQLDAPWKHFAILKELSMLIVFRPADKRANAPAKRKGGLTPEGRRRLAEAMKRRWAVKRTAAQAKKRGRKAA